MKSAVCAASLVASCALAESFPASEMMAKAFTSSQGQTIHYRIYVPKTDDPEAKFPAILFLHGAGERGTNNIAQLVHCIPQLMKYIVNDNHPAMLIVPQCPTGMQWVNTPWGSAAHTMPTEPSKPLQAVIELMDQACATAPVDQSRVYISGISMGGYGTWDMLQRFPERFAAGMPICGGGDTNLASKLINLPIHVVHGEKDSAVPVERSRSMVNAIEAAGGTHVTYLEIKGAGHNVWTSTFNDVKNIDWLFSNPPPK